MHVISLSNYRGGNFINSPPLRLAFYFSVAQMSIEVMVAIKHTTNPNLTKEEDIDKESIHSSTTPTHHMGK